jgi:hypothetical protein
MEKKMEKTNVLTKQISISENVYNKYIVPYMEEKHLRSFSIAIEQAFIEIRTRNEE